MITNKFLITVLKAVTILVTLVSLSCQDNQKSKQENAEHLFLDFSENILDYRLTPKDSADRSGLMFSDQGAWFAYSLPKVNKNALGFSGPFLMTQQNGVWSSKSLSSIHISEENDSENLIDFKNDLVHQKSYASHLEQAFKNEKLEVKQELFFISGHTAIQKTSITNTSTENMTALARIQGAMSDIGISISNEADVIKLVSEKSSAIGYIKTSNSIQNIDVSDEDKSYKIQLNTFELKPNETKDLIITQTFIFPEYSWAEEEQLIDNIDFNSVFEARKTEKNEQLKSIIENRKSQFKADKYAEVLAKAHLTLQNNWRIPAGELTNEGLFPSYHYEWFNGFWSWDSWKHAVGLSYYNIDLAKNQMRAMFDFQSEDGFIVDCIFRDTSIEPHNYRDTKPPLSACC